MKIMLRKLNSTKCRLEILGIHNNNTFPRTYKTIKIINSLKPQHSN